MIQKAMTWYAMLWFGHSFVSEHSIHWTGIHSLFMKQLPVSVHIQLVSTCHLWKLSLANIHFRKMSAEAEEKKGYVKQIIILTCASWDWYMVQNVSEYFVEWPWNFGLWNVGSMYVPFIRVNDWKLTTFFQGPKSKIMEGGHNSY